MTEKFCTDCGMLIKQRAEICPHCGCRQSNNFSEGKNRVVAIILALLLGGFGVHKFYLNKPWQGLCYLLFCWTFIPALIAFIEVIVYIFMSDQEFQRNYA